MDKFLIAFLTALSPLVVSLIAKYVENKNDRIRVKNRLEEAKSRLDFWNACFELQKKLIGETDLEQVKGNLSARLTALQLAIDQPHQEGGKEGGKPIHPRMPLRQSLFLIFRPLSWQGALLVVLFYFNLAVVAFVLIGVSADLTDKHATNQGIGIALLVIFLSTLLGLRYLALHTYKKDKAKRA